MSTINTDPNHILTLDEMKPKASSNGELGKDDFLKLFVAQLSHQDPMNPMNDQDMMGQMASFSQLEQITNMAAANHTAVVRPHTESRSRPRSDRGKIHVMRWILRPAPDSRRLARSV